MARVKQLADKDGELIYPVVDPTQLHFSGTQNDTVNGDGSIRSTYETNRKINFSAYGGTAIAENANLNTVTYNKVGKFFCASSPKAATLTNCPTSVAFTMEVSSAFNDNIDDESTGTWVYRKRIITDAYGYIWIQMNHSNGTAGSFSYGTWERITTNSGNAKNSTYLEGNGRISSADIAHQYDNDKVHQRLDIASSSMTTNKPAGDGFINTYSWDNTGSYDTQVYIPNGETVNNGMPQIRFRGGNANWGSWKNIITSNSMPSPSPTIVTDFGNISTDTTKTMSADGFITGKAITFATGEQAWISLDGVMVGGIPYSSFNGNIQVAFCIPVKKNSVVHFVKNGTAVFQQVRLQGYRY